MKYFLLTFNEDWADEHNVPALACMTEEEFEKWLKQPSGKLNDNYLQEKAVFDEKVQKYKAFVQGMKDRDLYTKEASKFTAEEKEWMKNNEVAYIYEYNAPTRLKRSFISAHLGNGGECFEESYTDVYLMEEYVQAGYVEVKEVNEDFYNTFKEADLASLSLCNVFTEMEDYGVDEDEEDNEED